MVFNSKEQRTNCNLAGSLSEDLDNDNKLAVRFICSKSYGSIFTQEGDKSQRRRSCWYTGRYNCFIEASDVRIRFIKSLLSLTYLC
ncbi:hypothetical protein VTP01DRAFT_984, partial [Rhizomucor pusillus]|uniref:uncharacterized protein n=1 Tax=Rhizomucor pusillus TaxID=4840 RepID=UPI0037427FCF